MKVTDAKGTEHEVTPGQWWWAIVDPEHDDTLECVQVDHYEARGPDGVWAVGGVEWAILFKDVVLLGPVVPYAAAVRTRRDVVLDPIPGDVLDTHLFDTHLYRVRVDKVEGGTVFATETWYDGATFAQNLSLGGWSRMLGGPRGRRFEVTPAWGSTVPCRAS